MKMAPGSLPEALAGKVTVSAAGSPGSEAGSSGESAAGYFTNFNDALQRLSGKSAEPDPFSPVRGAIPPKPEVTQD